ncbi:MULTISPECIES: ABC transporter substrate-binding protein [unclassified Chelatococcus]|uniref:ABC transporter substrate-binding protein n=1 Tax=unclassified Chelatococcus TaxID=2638111 RepID=UPI000316E4C2|nr:MULTISPECIES: ABC transporter substrate-binding protein [unclassified Chelatococcus]ALA18791.1 peptide ABC transporter substrate-binding protein [Chelatococcus sp. CO-6]
MTALGFPAAPLRRAVAGLALCLAAAIAGPGAGEAAPGLKETPLFEKAVEDGRLPPVAERVPQEPLVVDLEARGRVTGQPGGAITTLAAKARDIRYLSVIAYARLVGYDEDLNLVPDILASYEIEDGRRFTLHLRKGHRWSDGQPFTAEDFRYWWEDVALNRYLMPAGPPDFMLVDDEPPTFEVLDETTVRYTWSKPNPRFLPTLAKPLDPHIYRPAHFLKRFHARYTDPETLAQAASRQKLKSWAALHNRVDSMSDFSDPELPTLDPWKVDNAGPTSRFVFSRNPYYHRIDKAGQQLPYVDKVYVDIASSGLLAAKANAGEVDVLARGLTMADIPVLKQGEKAKGYRTLLWPIARGSEVVLYPNLNTADPVWRDLNRDVRFRRALSLGIDRRTVNNALFFGLGMEGNNTVREGSHLFEEPFRKLYGTYDPDEANRLLDEIGLDQRDGSGLRLLPDGRLLEIVVEVEGDMTMLVDTLQLIGEFWREIGVKLFIKPQDRTVLRNRAYSGLPVMTAAPGLDNAIPTPAMPPGELAPISQYHLSWPKWGQYVETHGKVGEACDMDKPKELLSLYKQWLHTTDAAEQARIWREMLALHAQNQWTIGTVAGAIQPIVLRNGLANFPHKALYSWEPTALIGIYRVDEMFWDRADRRVAAAQ